LRVFGSTSAESGAVAGVDHDRLSTQPHVAVPRAVNVRLTDERRIGCGEAAVEEDGHVCGLSHSEVLVEDDGDLGSKSIASVEP
jgi:hypothetical protein